MRPFLATLMAIWGICALAACETQDQQYDGVSRFAGIMSPYHGPGSPPREPPAPLPEDRLPPDGQTGNI